MVESYSLRRSLPHVILILEGGAPVPPPTFEQFDALAGQPIGVLDDEGLRNGDPEAET